MQTVDYAWLPEVGDRINEPLAQGSTWVKLSTLTPEAALQLALHGAPTTPLNGRANAREVVEMGLDSLPSWDSGVAVAISRSWLSVLAVYYYDGEFFLIHRPGSHLFSS